MNRYSFDPQPYKDQLSSILKEVSEVENWKDNTLRKSLVKYPKDGKGLFSVDQLIAGYNFLITNGSLSKNKLIEERLRMKPIRTQSGVAPVTVLTKPFPCPGKCIFCPNDVRMPKSYLRDEPGAQRAEMNSFDPYLQTYNRLLAMHNTGHNVEKVELIILGGTWSYYPESYQIWFVKRCFEAMNDFGNKDQRSEIKTKNIFKNTQDIDRIAKDGHTKTYNELINQVVRKDTEGLVSVFEKASWNELFVQQEKNEKANSKCVGLVIETRPDHIDEKEVLKIRKLGATKVQIGIQSLDDKVMKLNKRGHGRKETEEAIRLLRLAGFKIHAHWMPNLYGSTVENDIEDYKRLWEKEIRPDELKIYPTSIIANTELNDKFKEGSYKPYTYDELMKVLVTTIPETPRYCRLTRIIRDIPSTNIVAGNKLTNFRQIAENQIHLNGKTCECIRCREIGVKEVVWENLELETIEYDSSIGKQFFLSYKTKDTDQIVGFLRLSLPDNAENNFIEELKNKAMIREVHVYGTVVGIGKEDEGKSQHIGLGTKLIENAKEIAKENGYKSLSVISAIGTRDYYRKKGFHRDDLYMSSEV